MSRGFPCKAINCQPTRRSKHCANTGLGNKAEGPRLQNPKSSSLQPLQSYSHKRSLHNTIDSDPSNIRAKSQCIYEAIYYSNFAPSKSFHTTQNTRLISVVHHQPTTNHHSQTPTVNAGPKPPLRIRRPLYPRRHLDLGLPREADQPRCSLRQQRGGQAARRVYVRELA